MRNRRMYVPYAIATVIMSAMYFIIINVVFSKSISNMSFGPTMQALLTFGIVVMSIFTVAYMLYINSFLIKRRKQEFGLYAVLGLEKRHVGRIIWLENLMLNAVSLALGLLSGVVLGRLVFLLLLKLVRTAPNSVYTLSPSAFVVTVLIFAGIFLLTTLYNLNQVRLAKPAELLTGKKRGEKKVRGVIPLTILGLLFLGAAYFVAITTTSPGIALGLFWPAVILVIIATWMLFTAGSVFFFGALKKNKSYYYRPRNFIAVSGLMHRMKQNASGLYNICILSTMVLVTVSSCCALFFGQEEILSLQHPDDIVLSVNLDQDYAELPNAQRARAAVEALAEEHGVALDEYTVYKNLTTSLLITNGAFVFRDQNGHLDYSYDDIDDAFYNVGIITADVYTEMTGEALQLADDELLLLAAGDVGAPASLAINGSDYMVLGTVHDSVFTTGKNSADVDQIYFVAADDDAVRALLYALDPASKGLENSSFNLTVNISGEEESCLAFSEAVRDLFYHTVKEGLTAEGGYSYSNIFTSRADSNGLFGGLLFLGSFFTVLFLTNTVLIIYFKQISEGFDDRERFVILRKVGMSDEEVKRTINKQILIVFFLPLATALVHVLAASNMIARVLEVFRLYNSSLTLLCIGATSVVFALVYVIVYRFTAKTYYKLVRW